MSFEMASHHCFGIHADLDESDNEVIIELVSGHLPGVDPNSCTVGVYPYTTAIVLDEPLGQRTVVPAEPREPIAPNESAATPGGGITGDTTPGGTPTDNTGSDNTTPENTATDGTTPSTEPGTATTLDAEAVTTTVTEAQPPTEQTAAAGPVSGANALIGSYIEDGVEWALDNGLEWRVLSFDGVPYAEPTAENTNRISFVVEADRIVRLEWS